MCEIVVVVYLDGISNGAFLGNVSDINALGFVPFTDFSWKKK